MDKKKDNNKNHFLSRGEIMKYLKGELSPAEQHRIEKIMLEEGFEAEAMEGIYGEEAKYIERDLDHLKGRLKKRVRRRQGIGVLRIAATVILLTMFSFGIYFLLQRQPGQEQISYNSEKIPSEKEQVIKVPSSGEIIGPQLKKNVADAASREPSEGPNAETEELLAYDQPAKEADEKGIAAKNAVPPARIAFDKDGEMKGEKLLMASEVKPRMPVWSSGEGKVDAVNITATGNKNEVAKQIFPVEDAIADNNIQYAKPDMVFSEKARSFQEAVSDTAGKKKIYFAISDEKKDLSNAVEVDAAVSPGGVEDGKNIPARPSTGMSAYKKYIEENIRYPEEMSKKDIKGSVVVVFTVTATGEIKYLHIEKSLGNLFDREAVRLVVEGPRWLPAVEDGVKKEKEVRVRIRFVPTAK